MNFFFFFLFFFFCFFKQESDRSLMLKLDPRGLFNQEAVTTDPASAIANCLDQLMDMCCLCLSCTDTLDSLRHPQTPPPPPPPPPPPTKLSFNTVCK